MTSVFVAFSPTPPPVAWGRPYQEYDVRMRDLNFYIKHQFSCLADQTFRVLIDDENMIVTVISRVFDSSLLGWLLTHGLVDDHGVVAFCDDNSGWNPKSPPYRLRVRIGGDEGQEFDAQAVRLTSAVWGGRQVAITLEPTTAVTTTRDRDVT